jgi:hypothetical protein
MTSQSKYLVGTADEVEFVFLQEIGDDVLSEGVADASFVFAPTLHLDVRV